MATCKECLHVEACENLMKHLSYTPVPCSLFKDRSRFVELPADGIMYVIIDGRVTELLNLIIQPGDSGMCVLSPDNINKTIFSTKEQAEQALKEREGIG